MAGCLLLLNCGGERRVDDTYGTQRQQGLGNGVVCFLHVLCTVWRGTERGRVRAMFGYLIQSIILEVASVATIATDFGKTFYYSYF